MDESRGTLTVMPSEKTSWATVTLIAMCLSLVIGAMAYAVFGWWPIAGGVVWFALCVLISCHKYAKERNAEAEVRKPLDTELGIAEALHQESIEQAHAAAKIARNAGVDEEEIKDIYWRNGILDQYMPPK